MKASYIIEGIEEERSESEKVMNFNVKNCKIDSGIYIITVDLKKSEHARLDEDLEGCKAWWINDKEDKDSKGIAEIISVDSENEVINLRYLVGQRPKNETIIKVYPKQFLEELENLWKNSEYSKNAITNFQKPLKINSEELSIPIEFNWLRKSQKEAYKLFKYNKAILWGPPGTGKTTTLGTMLASYMIKNPNKKILLMSLTNLAVDQILLSVHEEIGKLGKENQKKCIRIGSNFTSDNFKNKEYLIATKDKESLEKMMELEKDKPEKENVVSYNQWLQKKEELKKKMKIDLENVMNNKNLLAMTTTRAIYEFLNLRKFDLVVFDEASQISLAQVIMLSQLGKQIIYSGDPCQLNPIAISEKELSKKWIGNSIFKYMESDFKDSTIFLDEQSRMKKEICDIVSGVFYDKKLIVADKLQKSWYKERELLKNDIFDGKIVCIEKIEKHGGWSSNYRGNIRYESAEKINTIVKKLLQSNYKTEDLIVLTPFKSQKNLIKNFLKKENIKTVKVQTIHKSQGSEFHTVIIDPVVGESKFLKTEEAKRIINVALSRAKARIVLCLSKEDLTNEVLKKVYNISSLSEVNYDDKIHEYIKAADFPYNLKGKIITYKHINGKVLDVFDEAKKIKILCAITGKEKIYGTFIFKK